MTKSLPKKTNAESSAVTKAKLLKAAQECLTQYGYTKTSTLKICQRAGVSNGSLLHHYRTRSNLLVATLRNVYQGMYDRIESLPKAKGKDSVILREYIKELFDIFDSPEMKAVLELWLASSNDADFRVEVLPIMEAFSDDLAPRVAMYLDLKESEMKNVAKIMRHIGILLSGYALSLISFGRDQPGESEVRKYLEESVMELLLGIADE